MNHPAKFRPKVAEVEAMQVSDVEAAEAAGYWSGADAFEIFKNGDLRLMLKDASMPWVYKGDWLIKDPDGTLSSMSDVEFQIEFEPTPQAD